MENVIPGPNTIFLTLIQPSQSIRIAGISVNTCEINLSKNNYELIKKFTTTNTDAFSWLEIKPKQQIPGKSYDIKDHNQVKRLLQNILDGVWGKGAWTNNHHYLPLKDAFFEMSENRDRRIRLRIPVNNVHIIK